MKFILAVLLFTCHFACEPKDIMIDKPLILIIAGQSNAVGVGDSLRSPSKLLSSFEYNSMLDSIVPLKDPVGQSHLNFESAKTGSLIPSLALALSELTNRSIFIIQCAKGGSALHPIAEKNNWGNWDESGQLLSNSFTKLNRSLSKINQKIYKTPNLSAIIWS